MKDPIKQQIKDYLAELPGGRKYRVKRHRHWLIRLLFKAIRLMVIFALIFGPFYYYLFHYTGDLRNDKGELLDLDKPGRSDYLKSTIIYSRKDKVTGKEKITGRFFYTNRDTQKSTEIPELVKNGFMAVEDKRFNPDRPGKIQVIDPYICDVLYRGFDPCAIARAFLGHYVFRSSKLSGASTIYQQLVRLYYGDEVRAFRDRDHSPWRKIKEIKLAIQLYKRYPREKILEDFLNLIYLGRGANGIAEASRRYFGKEMNELNAQEVAILASMNKSSKVYSPVFFEPDKNDPNYKNLHDVEVVRMSNARERYNSSLKRMLGDGYISPEVYEKSLLNKEQDLSKSLVTLQSIKDRTYEYSNRTVKQFLFSQGRTEKEISFTGGLRVYTTSDPDIQTIATEEFEKQLFAINEEKVDLGGHPCNDKFPFDMQDKKNKGYRDNCIEGAFVVIDIKTGEILAMTGGSDFNLAPYNRVFATRSPGSGIKPFIYATAFENLGYDLFTKACNTPFTMRGANGKPWSPQNFKDKNPRPQDCNRDIAEGIIYSLNLETLNIARKVGMPSIIDLMNRSGIFGNPGMVRDSEGNIWFRKPGFEITGGLDPGLPTAIGASGVNLIELANAYTTFFRGGKYIQPTFIREVRDVNGEILYKADKPKETQAFSEETATKVLSAMRAATKVGTSKISMRNIEQQVACKTGTSNGPKDVSIWCGSPEIFIGIRLGHDNYEKDIEVPGYMKKVSGDSEMLATGGWLVGQIARKFFDRAYANRAKVAFTDKVEENTKIQTDKYSGVK